MTSMYAAQPTMVSQYMPSNTVAAPTYTAGTTTVAQPTVITQAPSVVPASYGTTSGVPIQAQSYAAVPGQAFNMPLPTKMTEGLTTPQVLEQEKVAYGRALEAQLKKQMDAVFEEADIKKKMVQKQADTQIAQFRLQVEEKLKMDSLFIDQESQKTVAGLREAAITQQTQRDEQTAIQTADYIKKKLLEDFQVKSYGIQKQWFDEECKLNDQYRAIAKAGASPLLAAPK